MIKKKNILVIIGSTRANSSNLKVVEHIVALTKDYFEITVFDGISNLPHFNPDLDNDNPPTNVLKLRELISSSDGVLICTPEYVFSIPGSLKNAFEWCVSTTVFSQKPIGLITASASGEKAHQELQLIMKTLESKFTIETTLLISGIKGKFNQELLLTDMVVAESLQLFCKALNELIGG